jgi:hypothetical protein
VNITENDYNNDTPKTLSINFNPTSAGLFQGSVIVRSDNPTDIRIFEVEYNVIPTTTY